MHEYSGFDPSLWFLAEDADGIAGFALCLPGLAEDRWGGLRQRARRSARPSRRRARAGTPAAHLRRVPRSGKEACLAARRRRQSHRSASALHTRGHAPRPAARHLGAPLGNRAAKCLYPGPRERRPVISPLDRACPDDRFRGRIGSRAGHRAGSSDALRAHVRGGPFARSSPVAGRRLAQPGDLQDELRRLGSDEPDGRSELGRQLRRLVARRSANRLDPDLARLGRLGDLLDGRRRVRPQGPLERSRLCRHRPCLVTRRIADRVGPFRPR